MKNTQIPVLLAVLVAFPAVAFADNVPGHSKTGSNYVSFSEDLTDPQDSHGNSAPCNFLFGFGKENESRANSMATMMIASAFHNGIERSESVNLIDFGAKQDQDAFSDDAFSEKGKGPIKRNGHGGDSGGNGPVSGPSAPSPTVAVAEIGTQQLLLLGLACVGVFSYRRRLLTNGI